MVFYAWLLAEDETRLTGASGKGGVGKKTHDPQRNGSLTGAPLFCAAFAMRATWASG